MRDRLAVLSESSTQYEYELYILLETIGTVVRYLREEHGLAQWELAEAIGIPRCELSYLENGKTDLRVSTILRICITLGIPPNELVPNLEQLEYTASWRGGSGVVRRGPGLLRRSGDETLH